MKTVIYSNIHNYLICNQVILTEKINKKYQVVKYVIFLLTLYQLMIFVCIHFLVKST